MKGVPKLLTTVFGALSLHSRMSTTTDAVPTISDIKSPSSRARPSLPNAPRKSISDGHRSLTSSDAFFSSLDLDSSGVLTANEIKTFLGGFAADDRLDEPQEIEAAVEGMVTRLDRHDDGSISRGDINSYLTGIESLLNLDETADWVTHAVQLPASIGQLFRDNHVTGSEFPELIEDDGALLESELGISKPTWKKKLLKHIQMKLLGIGAVPATPVNFVVEEPHRCDVVNFRWDRVVMAGPSSVFPVHSYRVQRRLKSTKGGLKKRGGQSVRQNSSNASADVSRGFHPPKAIAPQDESTFKDIYKGIETEFVDSSLSPSSTYLYRVQAWNAVGHSQWLTLEYSTPNSSVEGCALDDDSGPLFPGSVRWFAQLFGGEDAGNATDSFLGDTAHFFSNSVFFAQMFLWLAQGFFTMIALVAAMMRLKRGSTTSTGTTNLVPIFPWLWSGINAIGHRILGVELVPSVLLTDVDSLKRASSDHDITYGAVGLAGSEGTENTYAKHMELRRAVSPHSLKINSDYNKMVWKKRQSEDEHLNSPRIGMIRNDGAVTTPRNRDRSERRGSVMGKLKGMMTKSERDSSTLVDTDSPFSGSAIDERYYDDLTRCNCCTKKFSILKGRHRHHCCRCLSTFCSKDGRTSHSGLTSCKIPGDCVCNRCLEVERMAVAKTAAAQ